MSDADDRPAPRGPAAWWATYRGWPALGRYSLLGLVAVLVLVLIAATTAAVLVRRPLPQTGGSLEIPGLEGPVEVLRDENGIPHIYADSTHDLMLAQGYVHAQERFFEMDVHRHATAGRLAELFGEQALDSDRAVRTMGWRRVAEQEVALVSPETRMALEAYADGVNAFAEPRGTTELGAQYTLLRLGGLDYTPEAWEPADSLAWLKAMAWDLRSNLSEEIERALATDRVGPRLARQLFPPYRYDEVRPVVSGGAVVDGVYEPDAVSGGTRLPTRAAWSPGARDALAATGRALEAAPSLLGRGDGLGSNAWVVSGEHTESGRPLLANDPHLGVSLPGVWSQVGLHCREMTDDCPLDVSGFGFAGFPGVLVGHNDRIAWGFTNLAPDVADLFVERVRGRRWLYDGRLRPLRVRRERIVVRGGDDVRIEVRQTMHGPLLSDVDAEVGAVAAVRSDRLRRDPLTGERRPRPDAASAGGAEAGSTPTTDEAEFAAALSWTALRPGRTADAILGVNRARGWRQFRAAARHLDVPSQNLLYADVEGHIGYQAPGRIPIRKSGNDGKVPVPGWRPENDWTGDVVPFEGLPHVLDPEDGLITSANQAVIGPEYPYFLTDDWDHGYRAERIRDSLAERIDAGEPIGVQDMTDLQLDTRNPMAPVLVPHLLAVDLPSGYFSEGQQLLEGWDFTQPADSAPAAYYNAVWDNLLEIGFHDELPATAWPRGGDRWFAVVTRLLERPRARWWDDRDTDGEREQLDDVLEAAMRDARDELTRELSRNAEEWEWGRLHSLELEGLAIGQSDNGLATGLVNRGPWRMPGGASIVNATGWDAVEGYEVVTAPSMRMVVDLDDLDASRWINATGVSGHPFSDNYTDQTDLWAEGRTLPWAHGEDAVADAAEDTLRLEPAPEDEEAPAP